MARKNGSGYKPWVAGVDMPLFSGKSWKELEDIWPREMRISSEVFTILAHLAPAWAATQRFVKATYGVKIIQRDFQFLCWMQRTEDLRENVATYGYDIIMPMNMGGKLLYLRKSVLTKAGFVENVPAQGARAYRITATGKMIMRKFVECLEQVPRDLRALKENQPADQAQKLTDRLLGSMQKESPE